MRTTFLIETTISKVIAVLARILINRNILSIDVCSCIENKMAQQGEKKKKESILDLSRFIDKPIRVKFQGGREVSGVLKGYDPLLNLVLDGATEFLRDPDDPFKITDDTRELGLTVCRGTSVVLICPSDNMEPIANPFLQQDG